MRGRSDLRNMVVTYQPDGVATDLPGRGQTAREALITIGLSRLWTAARGMQEAIMEIC
jgi:hypothetical protein